MMSLQETIQTKLVAALRPSHLEVINESSMHNVPPGSESHFRLRIVSDSFEGQPLVARHRRVNELLAVEIAGPVHALALETMTAAEWGARGGVGAESPECLGGGAGVS